MKTKERKTIQKEYARKNIDHFFSLLETRFRPSYNSVYIKEIKKISESFNIRLSREQKLKFCKKCNTYWDTSSREIRINSTLYTKDHICKNCGFTRRIPYKN